VVILLIVGSCGILGCRDVQSWLWHSPSPGADHPISLLTRLVCFRSSPLPQAFAATCAQIPQPERGLAHSIYLDQRMMAGRRRSLHLRRLAMLA